MTIAEQISRIAATLPEPLAKEALDFICFLQAREHSEFADWQNAQAVSLASVWSNPEDEVWNNVPFR